MREQDVDSLVRIFCDVDDFCKHFEPEWRKIFIEMHSNRPDVSRKIHLVSAWDCLRSLLLGQVKTAEKANEITAIPELIEGLDLTGAIVTIDAAGCQKEIVKRLLEKGGDYVIALKGNQENLLAEAENFFQQAACAWYEEAECDVASSIEKGHGRLEERTTVVINQLDWLDSRTDWAGLTFYDGGTKSPNDQG